MKKQEQDHGPSFTTKFLTTFCILVIYITVIGIWWIGERGILNLLLIHGLCGGFFYIVWLWPEKSGPSDATQAQQQPLPNQDAAALFQAVDRERLTDKMEELFNYFRENGRLPDYLKGAELAELRRQLRKHFPEETSNLLGPGSGRK